MQVAPEITVKGIGMSPRIDQLMARGIDKLERVCDYIISTRIALEQEQGRHVTGNPYRMRIDVRIPGRTDIIVERHSKGVQRAPDGDSRQQVEAALVDEAEPASSRIPRRNPEQRRSVREEPLYALIRRSFDAAQRELEKAVEKQRSEVKTPSGDRQTAVVDKLFRAQGYGFLRNPDGEEIYFHQNSVLHGHWNDLNAGSGVRYSGEVGEKGLQASTVELVQKPGVAEAHDSLHDLPEVAPGRTSTKDLRRQGRKTKEARAA